MPPTNNSVHKFLFHVTCLIAPSLSPPSLWEHMQRTPFHPRDSLVAFRESAGEAVRVAL
jgi:hypothetical protein